MLEYWIDNIYRNEKFNNITIFQKCFQLDKDLPCFCYHEKLSIAGNCRMCLVEVNNSLKLIVACAMPLMNNVVIYTNSERVKKARQAILEILLSSHPLDCPICDQAGECDLQDINLVFGSDKSRFYEINKRAVLNKDFGIYIKTVMTRCIHCTRCIRFLNEIAGEKKLGMVGRGSNSEISTYIYHYLHNELSGNIIDLCPVGALTSNPYMYTARPWELNSVESIDFFDIIGSNIRIDYLNNLIYRVVPVYNNELNEDWITNKVRFIYDSNNIQRLLNPFFFKKYDAKDYYYSISWKKGFFLFWKYFFRYSFKQNVVAFIGNFEDFFSVKKAKKFFNFLGIEIYIGDNIRVISDFRNDFLFNCDLLHIENERKYLFLWFNPRLELPLLNSRLRKFSTFKKFYSFGSLNNYYNINIQFFGTKLSALLNFLKGKSNLNLNFSSLKFKYKSFIFKFNLIFCCFIGFSLKFLPIFNQIYNFFSKFIWKFFNNSIINNMYPYMSYLNMLELGISENFYAFNSFKNDFIFLLGIDETEFLNRLVKYEDNKKRENFIVYYGSFFDNGFNKSNLIFPKLTLFEKKGIMLNLLGNLRVFNKAIDKKLSIQNNFFELLIRFLKIYKKKIFFNLYYNIIIYFKFISLNWNIKYNNFMNLKIEKKRFFVINNNIYIPDIIIGSYLYNYYKSDVYSRNSKIMHLASIDYLKLLHIFN